MRGAGLGEWAGPRERERGSREEEKSVRADRESAVRDTDGTEVVNDDDDDAPVAEFFTLPKDAPERAQSCAPATPHASRQ